MKKLISIALLLTTTVVHADEPVKAGTTTEIPTSINSTYQNDFNIQNMSEGYLKLNRPNDGKLSIFVYDATQDNSWTFITADPTYQYYFRPASTIATASRVFNLDKAARFSIIKRVILKRPNPNDKRVFTVLDYMTFDCTNKKTALERQDIYVDQQLSEIEEFSHQELNRPFMDTEKTVLKMICKTDLNNPPLKKEEQPAKETAPIKEQSQNSN